MVALDILLLVLMIYAVVRGLMKGFIMELSSLLGIVVSLFIAKNYGESIVGGAISFLGWQTEMNYIVSFIITFIAAMIAVRFFAILISKLIKFAMLEWLDKLLGGILSLVKCLMITGVMLYSFERINSYVRFVSDETLAKSKFYEPIKSFAYVIFPHNQPPTSGDEQIGDFEEETTSTKKEIQSIPSILIRCDGNEIQGEIHRLNIS